MIQTYPGHSLSSQRLRVMNMLAEHADFVPSTILIDGVDWTLLDPTELEEIKDIALVGGAELWITAVTTRHARSGDGLDLPPPCDRFDRLIDVAIHLSQSAPVSPCDCSAITTPTSCFDHAGTRASDHATQRQPRDRCVARGAPAQFRGHTHLRWGAWHGVGVRQLAERYGLREVNFSFAGREMERARASRSSVRRMRQGDVSLAYVSHRMGGNTRAPRTFGESSRQSGIRSAPRSKSWSSVCFRRWHRARWNRLGSRAGPSLEQATVGLRSGCGAVVSWSVMGQGVERCEPPTIQAYSFCGTGSRSLSAVGREAVELVFERSFGQRGLLVSTLSPSGPPLSLLPVGLSVDATVIGFFALNPGGSAGLLERFPLLSQLIFFVFFAGLGITYTASFVCSGRSGCVAESTCSLKGPTRELADELRRRAFATV